MKDNILKLFTFILVFMSAFRLYSQVVDHDSISYRTLGDVKVPAKRLAAPLI